MGKRVKACVFLMGILLISVLFEYSEKYSMSPNMEAFDEPDEIAVSVRTGAAMRQIRIWVEEETQEAYFFLPSYARLSDCCFIYDDEACSLCLGREKEKLSSGEALKDIACNESYLLEFEGKDGESCSFRVTFLKSENLPALYLDTESGSLAYLYEDKENREGAAMEIVDSKGKVDFYEDLKYIKGHGNNTWEGEKRPFQIALEEPASLLGMDSGKKWILFANSLDPSYIRNRIAYDLAEEVGMPYTSQLRYVDLYINSEYRGNYQLVEKIEIGPGRIDIQDLEAENDKVNTTSYRQNVRFGIENDIVKGVEGMNDPEDITGGYLLERNYGKKYKDKVSGFITQNEEKFVVRAPSYASKEQIAYIADVTQSVENAIFSPDGIDSKTGLSYTELLDEDSMVMKYLLEEIVLNQANGTTSAWFYKPQNEISTKLYAGPVWDYDKAFGAFGSYRNPRLLSKLCCYRKEHTRWYEELYKKEEFLQQVKEKYAEVFRPETKAVLDGKIDRYADEIRESVAMDRIRWSVEEDFEDSVEDIKTWLGKRIEFLDEVWLQNRQFCLIRYQNEEEDICAASSVPYAGPVDENVDLSEFGEDIEHLLYWYDAENDEIYYPGSGKAVTEDIILTPVYDLSQGVDGALGAVE